MNVDAVAARHSRRRKHHRHQFNSSLLSGEVAVSSNVKHVASSSRSHDHKSSKEDAASSNVKHVASSSHSRDRNHNRRDRNSNSRAVSRSASSVKAHRRLSVRRNRRDNNSHEASVSQHQRDLLLLLGLNRNHSSDSNSVHRRRSRSRSVRLKAVRRLLLEAVRAKARNHKC